VTSSPLSARPVKPVLADLLPGERVRDVALVGLYALAIAASAQVAFPLPGTPVPVTGQTLVVLLGAAALGTGRAAIGASLYAVIGLIGVPWFAVSSGASLGYIAGFVAAAWVVGRFARAGTLSTTKGAAFAMVLGNLAIYALGATVLAIVLSVGPAEAFAMGVAPFLLGDAVKLAIATALLPATQRLLGR
jgi:biotin transport system substrate-specific component